MDILVLHSELGVLRGGGENFTRNLFTALARRQHRIAAVFAADPQGCYPIPLPDSIEPIPLAGWWRSNLGQATLSLVGRHISDRRCQAAWNRIQTALSWRAFRWHKRRFQRRVEREIAGRWKGFDAVYVHGDVSLAAMAARHRPTVLRLPGPITVETAPMLRAVHAVCANGDALLKIREFLGETARELPLGLNDQLFKPGDTSVRRELGWTEGNIVLGYVGRLNHLKGVDLLSAAFREISRIFPNVKLLLIGGGEEEPNIRSDLAKELSRKVVHMERDIDHDSMPEWYRAMNLLVMPSRYENFSNAILEGMACGVPFLASDVGGNTLLGQSDAGWLFQAQSVPSLITSLTRLLQSASMLKARGEAGIAYVRNYHSWAATAERLDGIFQSCVSERHV